MGRLSHRPADADEPEVAIRTVVVRQGTGNWPSRKWWVATVSGLLGLAVLAVQAGGWHVAETVVAVTLVSQRFAAWATPNDEPPPVATLESGKGR
jgi:hypothetical protein